MSQRRIAYDEFAHRNSIPIYMQSWYLDALCQNQNWDYVAYEKGDRILAIWVYHIKKKGPYTYIPMPLLCKFMGPQFDKAFSGRDNYYKALKSLEKKLPRCSHITQTFHYTVKNILPLVWSGYQDRILFSYQIDNIQDLDRIWKNVDSDYRNNKIKKAAQKLSISETDNTDLLYQMVVATFKKQNLNAPYSAEYLSRHWQSIKNNKVGKIFIASDESNKVHAAIMVLIDNKTCIYHIAGQSPLSNKSGASVYLIWHAIKYANKMGCEIFDFEGSTVKTIARVRKNFGAKPSYYIHCQKYNSTTFRLLEKLKNKSAH